MNTTTLSPIITDYLIELIQRGYQIPVFLTNDNEQFFLSLDRNTHQYHVYSKATGLLDISLSDIKKRLADGMYELGYSKAVDRFGTEIKVGDIVLSDGTGIVSKVKKVILEPQELVELRMGDNELKPYYKYNHILKPIVKVEFLYILQPNQYTGIDELRPVMKDELKNSVPYLDTERLIISKEHEFKV